MHLATYTKQHAGPITSDSKQWQVYKGYNIYEEQKRGKYLLYFPRLSIIFFHNFPGPGMENLYRLQIPWISRICMHSDTWTHHCRAVTASRSETSIPEKQKKISAELQLFTMAARYLAFTLPSAISMDSTNISVDATQHWDHGRQISAVKQQKNVQKQQLNKDV